MSARGFDTDVSPYLRAHSSLAEVFRPVTKVGSFRIDDDAFVRNREFANLMVQYRASASRRSFALEDLLSALDEIVPLLEGS